jgi:hypothetical protein
MCLPYFLSNTSVTGSDVTGTLRLAESILGIDVYRPSVTANRFIRMRTIFAIWLEQLNGIEVLNKYKKQSIG